MFFLAQPKDSNFEQRTFLIMFAFMAAAVTFVLSFSHFSFGLASTPHFA